MRFTRRAYENVTEKIVATLTNISSLIVKQKTIWSFLSFFQILGEESIKGVDEEG